MSSNLTRWNPLRDMTSMQNWMDRMFEQSWRPLFEEPVFNANSMALDVDEDDEGFIISTELPGVKPENINVHLDGDVLVIDAVIPEATQERKERRALIRERRYGRYSRRLRLPQPVSIENVEANYADGVLTLTLPKAQESQPKTIPVRATQMIEQK